MSVYVCVCVVVYINVCRMGGGGGGEARASHCSVPSQENISNSDLAGPVLVRGSQRDKIAIV